MLHRVLAIALNTYRESVRARILLGLAGVAFAVALFSLVVGAFTLRNAPRVVSDLGVAAISIFGIMVAIVAGSTSLHRELEQKTIFPMLARPIRRGEYVVGKYLGTMLTIVVFVMADAGLVLLLSSGLGGRPPEQILGIFFASVAALAVAMWRFPKARTYGPIPWAAALLVAGMVLASVAPEERRVVLGGSLLALLEVGIVAAIGLLFSSFSTPFLSALLTLGMVVIGRSADQAKYFGPTARAIATAVSKVVPNLHVFVPPRPLFTGEVAGVPLAPYLGMAAVSAVAWSVGLLAVAAFIFKKRDFL
ncbi:PilI [Minicystis rosea]|nr:PilI [Minicystis rosea]